MSKEEFFPRPEANLSDVSRYSIRDRFSKVNTGTFAEVPVKNRSFLDFFDALPNILNTKQFKRFTDNLIEAKRSGDPLFWSMGGHVIKVGLAPVLIELIKKGWVQGLVMNSAASIHDSEIARFGNTSEDVNEAIRDGSFGMARETSVEYIKALKDGYSKDLGWGESMALWLSSINTKTSEYSVLKACWDYKIPVTVHGALGTDIIWQHPELNGEIIGKLGERDFKKLIELLKNLEGGAFINFGSAVILPEVFLKAFTCARNLGAKIEKFTSANFDQIQHYRPRVNILDRPTSSGGSKFAFTGHHEFLMPLLAQVLIEKGS